MSSLQNQRAHAWRRHPRVGLIWVPVARHYMIIYWHGRPAGSLFYVLKTRTRSAMSPDRMKS